MRQQDAAAFRQIFSRKNPKWYIVTAKRAAPPVPPEQPSRGHRERKKPRNRKKSPETITIYGRNYGKTPQTQLQPTPPPDYISSVKEKRAKKQKTQPHKPAPKASPQPRSRAQPSFTPYLFTIYFSSNNTLSLQAPPDTTNHAHEHKKPAPILTCELN